MALSSSGRKLTIEVVGCVAALVLCAIALSRYQDVKRITVHAMGVQPAEAPGTRSPRTAATDIESSPTSRRQVELTAGRNGHFFAEAEINGRSVPVMVDTGASMVALTYEDARRAGIAPRDSEFTGRANTANGIAKFAGIQIDRISIGGVEVRNVEAAVMEDGKLDTTLLGMSFLGKLGRVDMRSGRLVLEE